MKKLLSLMLCILLLTGCGTKAETTPVETYVISGTIVERKIHRYFTNFLIELDDGIKVPVYDDNVYSNGLQKGDKVRFKVKNTVSGYKVVDIIFTKCGEQEKER